MRLMSFTDYGLRVLMRLAGEPTRMFTVNEIAKEFGISRDHLTKIVRSLAKHGFVKTQRGVSGGVKLAKDAKHIRMGDVVAAMEDRHALVECLQPGKCACRLMPGCRLKAKLARAEAAFYADLNRTTLAACAWKPA